MPGCTAEFSVRLKKLTSDKHELKANETDLKLKSVLNNVLVNN